MAERLDFQGRLQEAQQRLIYEILGQMWREEAVTNLVQKACDFYEETEKVMRGILNKDNEQLYFSKDKMSDNCQAWDWPNHLCYENDDNDDDGDDSNSWYRHNEE